MKDDRDPVTVEEMLRTKAATGYDPVQVMVGIRGVNENDVVIAIAGARYSVKGNHVVLLEDGAAPVAEPTAEEGNTNSPQSEPAADAGNAEAGAAGGGEGALTEELQNRLDGVALKLGAQEVLFDHESEAGTVYKAVDVAGEVVATGTLAELEAL